MEPGTRYIYIRYKVDKADDDDDDRTEGPSITGILIPPSPRPGSGGLQLGADPVARDLVPVDLGPRHRQLPPQGLEGRVRHRL